MDPARPPLPTLAYQFMLDAARDDLFESLVILTCAYLARLEDAPQATRDIEDAIAHAVIEVVEARLADTSHARAILNRSGYDL